MAYDGAAEPTTDKSPFLRQAQAMDIPLTQPPASSSPTANPDLPSSEQGSTANAEAADGQPPSKKMRGEAPLVASMFSENFLAVKAATKSHFCAQAATVEQWRVNAFFKRTFPQVSADLLQNVPRWWVAAGLAERDPNQKVGTKVILKAPPPDMLETVADALADVFSFTKEERTNFLKIWETRDVSTTFNKDDFDRMCGLLRCDNDGDDDAVNDAAAAAASFEDVAGAAALGDDHDDDDGEYDDGHDDGDGDDDGDGC
ncbi:hypothetical protein AK812_SmicGene47905 [Symbiodinium microadriaticum]|uniref:Uncharacterized protein n=1 Tax=Symbiodinium microadriaticum TaxID=2951 RepID=A0A1Q9BQR5_SYMMI|nr:hypothetical protein AK812_SmicGene47905 [Symbiodinium microadriaticum]